MSTMKLRQQVLQDVISLMDKDWAMDILQAFLEDLKEREKDGRIPGLPYTEEERKRAIRCAENDWSMGRTHTHEEVVADWTMSFKRNNLENNI